MWSIDPALALSMYDSERREDEVQTNIWMHCSEDASVDFLIASPFFFQEEECHAEMADTDCTWISHSVLQRRLENSPDREDSVCGEKTGRSHVIPIFRSFLVILDCSGEALRY